MQDWPESTLDRLKQLQDKYAHMGQDLNAYLEGLLHTRTLTYEDYLQMPALLSLQTPRTDFADELIFIAYHQITELYFKLIRHELHQILGQPHQVDIPPLDATALERLDRVVRYFRQLVGSQEIMVRGMDKDQFLQFRMALLPASGFQSLQFRQIELELTGLGQLCKLAGEPGSETLDAEQGNEAQRALLYEQIYWKLGNRELQSGAKTLTLRAFEAQHDDTLRQMARELRGRHLYARFLQYRAHNGPLTQAFADKLKLVELYGNLFWRLSHYRAAARYLDKKPEAIKATGGTNWQDYLPPRRQGVIYFPVIWPAEDRQEWGTRTLLAKYHHLLSPLLESEQDLGFA
jgi:tryptophan 2,3-dioxygenase